MVCVETAVGGLPRVHALVLHNELELLRKRLRWPPPWPRTRRLSPVATLS